MADKLLVTGGTGLTGSVIALRAAQQGQNVRILVRGTPDVSALTDLGVEVVQGDITDRASLDRAMDGVTGVINAAAALAGTWGTATPEQLWAVNHDGALNVLDAAAAAGVKRTVIMDSNSIVDPAFTQTERSPIILITEHDSPYVRAKRAMFYETMHRASQGQDIVVVTPGAIYGPGVFADRALDDTTFTRMLLRSVLGEMESYIRFPMNWTYVPDLAEVCIRALDKGQIGRRYLAMGDEADVCSIAQCCNDANEIAGVPYRLRDIDPLDPDAPDIKSMRQFAERKFASPLVDCSETTQALGYAPTPRLVGLQATIDWFREIGRLAKD